MTRMKLTRRQFPFTPRFLPSPLFPDFGDLNATTQQLFEEMFGKNVPAQVEGWAPAVNMAETKDEYTVTAELPGLKPGNVSVDFTDGMLTIRGEKVDEKTEKEDDRTYYFNPPIELPPGTGLTVRGANPNLIVVTSWQWTEEAN